MSAKPTLGCLSPKFWGTNLGIFESDSCEIHFITAKSGGFSSRHKHILKNNRFFVISGKLKITTFRETGEEVIILSRGQFTDVVAGDWHKFECIEDAEAIEVYWCSLSSSDIVRDGFGGMKES